MYNKRAALVFGWVIYSVGMTIYIAEGFIPFIVHTTLGPLIAAITIGGILACPTHLITSGFCFTTEARARLTCCLLIVGGLLLLLFGHKIGLISDKINPHVEDDHQTVIKFPAAIIAYVAILFGILHFPQIKMARIKEIIAKRI